MTGLEPPPPEASVAVATSDRLLRAAYDMRLRVFSDEQGYGEDLEIDSYVASRDSVADPCSIDAISTPLVLMDPGDTETPIRGVLRVIPYPIPDIEEVFYKRAEYDAGAVLPGAGRTIAEMKAHLASCMLPLDRSADGSYVLLSGGKLGRIAVDRQLRGTGLGRRLVLAAEDWIAAAAAEAPAAKGAKVIEAKVQLSAQVVAREFYERIGYQPVGEQYLEQGQPHVWYTKMKRVDGDKEPRAK